MVKVKEFRAALVDFDYICESGVVIGKVLINLNTLTLVKIMNMDNGSIKEDEKAAQKLLEKWKRSGRVRYYKPARHWIHSSWASYAGDGGAINAYDIKAWFSENEVTI